MVTAELIPPSPCIVEQFGPPDPFSFEKDIGDAAGVPDILERIAVYDEQIRFVACSDPADSAVRAKQLRGFTRGGLQNVGGRNSGFLPQLHFTVQSRTVKNSKVSGVGTEDERHSRSISVSEIPHRGGLLDFRNLSHGRTYL